MESKRVALAKMSLQVEFVYLRQGRNSLPTVAIDGKIPELEWSRSKICYSPLRVFGCEVNVHMPKENRSKIESRARECIFLGYGGNNLGYRLWNPKTKQVVRSRDVREDTRYYPKKGEDRAEAEVDGSILSQPIKVTTHDPNDSDDDSAVEHQNIDQSESDQSESDHSEDEDS